MTESDKSGCDLRFIVGVALGVLVGQLLWVMLIGPLLADYFKASRG